MMNFLLLLPEKIPQLIKLYFWWTTQVCNKNTLTIPGVYILLKKDPQSQKTQ